MAPQIGIVLLAAGGSARLGQPKQLLQYKGQSLLRRAVQAAEASIAGTVVAVVGAHADVLKKEIGGRAVVVENRNWQEGMASSIRCGISALLQTNPHTEGVILVVCDQPYLTTSLLNELINAHAETGKPIVASGYANTFGPPNFFHKRFFVDLLNLKGDVGARRIVSEHADDVAVVPFSAGAIDIDTATDYEKLSKEKDTE